MVVLMGHTRLGTGSVLAKALRRWATEMCRCWPGFHSSIPARDVSTKTAFSWIMAERCLEMVSARMGVKPPLSYHLWRSRTM